MRPDLTFHPLTEALWPALEALFGPERGANGGCWCQYWRLTSKEYGTGDRAARKAAFHQQVSAGEPLGVLALAGSEAVAWCAVAPRPQLPKLMRSRVAKPLEDLDPSKVWMINCFFVARGHRKGGLMPRLIEAAVHYAKQRGALAVEACPIEPKRQLQFGEGYVGLASAFAGLGFHEVARRSDSRPLLRCLLSQTDAAAEKGIG